MDTLSERMKNYESAPSTSLTRRVPVIIRLDGKAFHTFTKGFNKPFDEHFIQVMADTTQYLCSNIQGCVYGYTQSDEISLVLIDYQSIETSAWLNYRIQKLVSVSASMATSAFNKYFIEETNKEANQAYMSKYFKAMFDSRAFNLPKDEVANYILWRQQDASRNSILSLAQSYFPQSELTGKNKKDIQDKLIAEQGIDWNSLPIYKKHGLSCIKVLGEDREGWGLDYEMPIISQCRQYINDRILYTE